MRGLLLLLGLFLGASAFAKSSLLKPGYPPFVRVGETVLFEPMDGHHFNTKAPQYCGELKAKSVQELELVCVFKKSGVYKVNFKICDNKKTFCKIERTEISVTQ